MVSRIIWQDYWIKCELYLQLNAFLVCQFFIHCHTFDTTLSPTDCILELFVTGFCLFFFYWKNAGDFPGHPVAKTLHSQWAPLYAGGPGSIPGQGTRSYMPQLRSLAYVSRAAYSPHNSSTYTKSWVDMSISFHCRIGLLLFLLHFIQFDAVYAASKWSTIFKGRKYKML